MVGGCGAWGAWSTFFSSPHICEQPLCFSGKREKRPSGVVTSETYKWRWLGAEGQAPRTKGLTPVHRTAAPASLARMNISFWLKKMTGLLEGEGGRPCHEPPLQLHLQKKIQHVSFHPTKMKHVTFWPTRMKHDSFRPTKMTRVTFRPTGLIGQTPVPQTAAPA